MSEDGTLIVPVLNIPESQFRLRTETTYFFRKLQIPTSCLVFRDQLDLATLHTDNKLQLTLVDHNILTGSDVIMEDCVSMVIDHHVRERLDYERLVIMSSTKSLYILFLS